MGHASQFPHRQIAHGQFPHRQFPHRRIARRCEQAVVTAYSELRQRGSDDMSSFVACTTLYRIHHPEASLNEARRLVAEWVDQHLDRATGAAREA